MKNSQVKDWEGFSATLKRTGTKHLDLRKILVNAKTDEAVGVFWGDCIKALSKVPANLNIYIRHVKYKKNIHLRSILYLLNGFIC